MAAHTIITGETGNTYTLLEKIGSGAYGTVYKGLWQQLGRHVAVKRVATGRFSVDEERALRSEIELFKNLKHPHIVNYIEAVHASDDYLDIVMEYVEGGSLFAVINHIRRSLPPDACLSAYCEGDEDDNFDDMLGDFDDGAFAAPSSDSALSQERMRQSDGDPLSSMIAPSSSSHLSDRLLKLDLDDVPLHQPSSVPESVFDWGEPPAAGVHGREPDSSAPASAPPWPEPIFDDADALADVTLTEKPLAMPAGDYPAPETPVRSAGGSRSVVTGRLPQHPEAAAERARAAAERANWARARAAMLALDGPPAPAAVAADTLVHILRDHPEQGAALMYEPGLIPLLELLERGDVTDERRTIALLNIALALAYTSCGNEPPSGRCYLDDDLLSDGWLSVEASGGDSSSSSGSRERMGPPPSAGHRHNRSASLDFLPFLVGAEEGASRPAAPVHQISAQRLSPGVRAAWSVPSGALGSYPLVRDVREDLCLAGFLPVAMRLCDRRRPAAVRLRAAQLLDVVLELPSTLQMLVACRGFTVYVDMLSDGEDEDRVDGDGGRARQASLSAAFPLPPRQRRLQVMMWELWELALRGINRMLNMESGRYKRDFCRRFAWCGLLEPIAAALLRTGQGGRQGLLPDASDVAIDGSSPSPFEHRIVALARLLQSFAARADSVVKARMATAGVLEPMIAALQQGTTVDSGSRVNGWTGSDAGGQGARPGLDAVAAGEDAAHVSARTADTPTTTPPVCTQATSFPALPAGSGSSMRLPDAPQPSLPTAAREALFNCLRDLSRDPLTHEALTSAGALRVLVGELGRPSTSVELARCVVSSVCDLCMVSAERQEAAAVAGLVPHLEVAIRSHDVNLSAVCISIYSGLGLAGPRSRAALSAASGVDTYTQLLSSSTTLARWQARILSSLAEWLDVDAAHVEARLSSTAAVNHVVVCMSRLQLRHAEAMLEPYRALVATSRTVNKALGGRRTLIRLFTQWLSPPGWAAATPPSLMGGVREQALLLSGQLDALRGCN
ncbi:hypothetical protein I4F81_009434 [Pyropia yezoensis]|uniref:Uncharacterized protein n=1 Tax=Pyropia yezoensis TaxID=2788 RepID=A0ACC3CAU6_PYRYE|nr:hypothetical protein I4F81_009434 [Neopyropia yezoensis]